MNRVIGALFGAGERAVRMHELRKELICMRCSQMLLARRLSYLESRHPDIHDHICKSKPPVAMLRQSDKDKIAADVDQLLEGL